jgi:hypothetical protein
MAVEIRHADHVASSGRSVSIVRSQTQAMGFLSFDIDGNQQQQLKIRHPLVPQQWKTMYVLPLGRQKMAV